MSRQYVAIRFRPHDRRTYTYHNDGPPVAVGETVKFDGRDGLRSVEVVEIVQGVPPFATKPIGPKSPGETQGLFVLGEIEREQRADDRNRGG